MTYAAEVPKEYLREAFQRGWLDVTNSYQSIRGFVEIFTGELDALVAISQCHFLEPAQIDALMKIAAPPRHVANQFAAW